MTTPDTAQAFAEDERFMREALREAQAAREEGEVPVGAVVVREGRVIATGRNRSIRESDPTAHAEVVALRAAARALGNYRLDGCDLYVTLEPCPMCSGAMFHARLRRVVYGAPDPRTGTAGSVIDLFAMPQLNHRSRASGGVLVEECRALLHDFFREKRRAAVLRYPLRDDALRAPEQSFAGVPIDPDGIASYLHQEPALEGLRLHVREIRPIAATGDDVRSADRSDWLCLHGPSNWSQRFAAALRLLALAGLHAAAPDLIGFGRSDKPKREAFHTVEWHAESLRTLVEALGLRRVVVVVEEGNRSIGQRLVESDPIRFRGLVVLQEHGIGLPPIDAWHAGAPFPDRGHRAGPRALGRAVLREDPGKTTPPAAHSVPILRLDLDPQDPADDAPWLTAALRRFPSFLH